MRDSSGGTHESTELRLRDRKREIMIEEVRIVVMLVLTGASARIRIAERVTPNLTGSAWLHKFTNELPNRTIKKEIPDKSIR